MTMSCCLKVVGAVLVSSLAWLPSTAYAQTKPASPQPARPAPAPPPDPIGVRGVVTVGRFQAQAQESFDAVLGTDAGVTFGGGAQLLLPRGFYVEVTASRFKQGGERVFIGPNDEVFPLGIPVDVTLTPIEITGGWRYRRCPPAARTRTTACRPRWVPYGGAGFSSYRYQETSPSDLGDESVDERFGGFHVLGGVDYLVWPWLAVGGELAWASIPDSLGAGGVSAAFGEDNLGGTSLRLKISIGR